MVGFLGWSLLLVRAAASDQIGVRVDCLGGWGGLLLGFCGWWLVVGLWRWRMVGCCEGDQTKRE